MHNSRWVAHQASATGPFLFDLSEVQVVLDHCGALSHELILLKIHHLLLLRGRLIDEVVAPLGEGIRPFQRLLIRLLLLLALLPLKDNRLSGLIVGVVREMVGLCVLLGISLLSETFDGSHEVNLTLEELLVAYLIPSTSVTWIV